MTRLFSGLPFLLLYCSAYADEAGEVPLENSGMTGFIVFGIIFVVICVGFVWMVVSNDKKQKDKQPKD